MQLTKYKRKKTQALLTISHGPQKFCKSDTTRDRKTPSSTQQHFEFSHQSMNKQTSQQHY
jgi:hypothetical protein